MLKVLNRLLGVFGLYLIKSQRLEVTYVHTTPPLDWVTIQCGGAGGSAGSGGGKTAK